MVNTELRKKSTIMQEHTTNGYRQITFAQILTGELNTSQVIEAVLAYGDHIGEIDKKVLFYCLNAIIYERVEIQAKIQLIQALYNQVTDKHCWAAGALTYLILRLPPNSINFSIEDYQTINELLGSNEAVSCPICLTTQGLAFQFGWQTDIDLEEAKQLFIDAIKLDYTPAVANLACLLFAQKNSAEAYTLLIRYLNRDCAITYNLALCHLTGCGAPKDQIAADKKYRMITAITDLNLLVGQGNISEVLLQHKEIKQVQFTIQEANKTEEPAARKKLKVSASGKEPTAGKTPPLSLFQTPQRAPAKSPASTRKPKQNNTSKPETNYKKLYEKEKRSRIEFEKRYLKAKERGTEAYEKYKKARAKYKKLKAEMSAIHSKINGHNNPHQPPEPDGSNFNISGNSAFRY